MNRRPAWRCLPFLNLAVGSTSLATHWASGTALQRRFIREVQRVPVTSPIVVFVANGETDLDSDADTNAYGTNMGDLIDAVETAGSLSTTDIIWAIAKLSTYSTRGTSARRTTMRDAQDALAAARDNVYVIDTDTYVSALTDGDQIRQARGG